MEVHILITIDVVVAVHGLNGRNNDQKYVFTHKNVSVSIGPLHNPVTWCGINYAGTQIMPRDFQTKERWAGLGNMHHMMADNSRSQNPSLQRIHGVPCRPGTTREMIEALPRLVAREKDIYVVSYPKAGTTWTQEIVWQVLHGGRIDYRRIDVRIPWIEGMFYPYRENPYKVSTVDMIEKMFESFPSPRVFKSHLRYQLIPKATDNTRKPRYIYVMRNPKDTAVSFYHHSHFIAAVKDPPSWVAFFDQFIKGEVNFGSWFDHVLSWWEHRDDPNVLFVKYEDMKKDPQAAIDKIARFIGVEISRETLAVIVQQTTVEAMKNEGNANYKWMADTKGDFIRKGEIGDWQAMFSDEQNKMLENIYKEKLAGTGLEFDFDKK